jgi:hypothetical protein
VAVRDNFLSLLPLSIVSTSCTCLQPASIKKTVYLPWVQKQIGIECLTRDARPIWQV